MRKMKLLSTLQTICNYVPESAEGKTESLTNRRKKTHEMKIISFFFILFLQKISKVGLLVANRAQANINDSNNEAVAIHCVQVKRI